MEGLLGVLGLAVVVFASTNVDDIFLLAAFFADPQLRARSVVLGQFLGIGALVVASAVAALASLVVPEGVPALLGVVPLVLGLRKLWELRRAGVGVESNEGDLRGAQQRAEVRTHSQVLAVAAVTVANGGDNLGVYIPLFARDPSLVPVYAIVFALMTALWCFAGHRLVANPVMGRHVRRYGHIALPIVLIALGVWILTGARVLISG